MKKIMFNDKYGLTAAVLEGRKTQTRRIINAPRTFRGQDVNGYYIYRNTQGDIIDVWMKDYNDSPIDEGQILPMYKLGEVVAVAQRYQTIFTEDQLIDMGVIAYIIKSHNGWANKMFVKPELMPHQIRITWVRIERLQDISDADCLREGIEFSHKTQSYYVGYNKETGFRVWLGNTPRDAYAELIDKVSGKGTWESNPYVFVYDFELVK